MTQHLSEVVKLLAINYYRNIAGVLNVQRCKKRKIEDDDLPPYRLPDSRIIVQSTKI